MDDKKSCFSGCAGLLRNNGLVALYLIDFQNLLGL